MSLLIPRLSTSRAQRRLLQLEEHLTKGGDAAEFAQPSLADEVGGNLTGGSVAAIGEVQRWRTELLKSMQAGAPLQRSDFPKYGALLGRALDEVVQPIPSDAAHDSTWSFLSLAVVPELVLRRWAVDAEGSLNADRWIGRAAPGGRDRLYLKTVWRRWRTLGELMLEEPILGEDTLVQLFERSAVARNKSLVKSAARCILAVPEGKRMDFARELMKLVSFQTGSRLLDVLTDLELDELICNLAADLAGNHAPATVATVVAPDAGNAPADASEPSALEWSDRELQVAMSALSRDAPDQAQVILWAVAQGGVATRDEIYRLCGYPASRMLRGFTRPLSRVTATLVEWGDVRRGLPQLLTPNYTNNVATSFSVPPEVVAHLRAN